MVWIWFPVVGPIRTSTVLTTLVLFFAVLWLRRDLLRAVVAVIAWTASFEIVYQAVGTIGFHWQPGNFVWVTAALAGWIILAGVLGIWPDWRVGFVFVVLMSAWIASGYHYNVAGQSGPIDTRAEILNETAKSALALAYLVGAMPRFLIEKRPIRQLKGALGPKIAHHPTLR